MGHRRNRQYAPRTPELELLVCRDYHPGGKSLREIATERRLSLTGVHSILVWHSVPRRPPGNHRKLKARRGSAYDAEVIQRFRARESLVQIARTMRTSRRLVMAVVREYKLTRERLSPRGGVPALHASPGEPR